MSETPRGRVRACVCGEEIGPELTVRFATSLLPSSPAQLQWLSGLMPIRGRQFCCGLSPFPILAVMSALGEQGVLGTCTQLSWLST